MRVPNDHPLACTYALLDAEFAAPTAELLRGTTERAEVEGLVELVLNPEAGATAAIAALRALEHDTSPLVSDTVVRALASPHPSVRIFAAGEVARRELVENADYILFGLVGHDTFWQVRRAALNALAAGGYSSACRFASIDPHWRVRYAVAQVLEPLGRDPDRRADVLSLLHEEYPRGVRVGDYLRYRWTGELPPERAGLASESWCPFWDWDAAVLARNIELLGRAGRRDALGVLARLINHSDERVRRWVIQRCAMTEIRDTGPPHLLNSTTRARTQRQ